MKKSNGNRTKPPTPKEVSIDEKVPTHIIAETYGPKDSRKNCGQQEACRDAICRNEDFKKDVQELQRAFPLSYWLYRDEDQRKLQEHISLEWEAFLKRVSKKHLSKRSHVRPGFRLLPTLKINEIASSDYNQLFFLPCPSLQDPFRAAIESFSHRWGLEGVRHYAWLVWLVRRWDISKQDVPDDEPEGIVPPDFTWSVKWYYGPPSEAKHCVLTLRQGVSQRQAIQLVKDLIPQLKSPIKRRGAPRITKKELKIIHQQFDLSDIPERPPRGLLNTIIEGTYTIMKQSSVRIQKRMIREELRKYREAKGHKVKKYWPREVSHSSGD